jgi:hypothetical protein
MKIAISSASESGRRDWNSEEIHKDSNTNSLQSWEILHFIIPTQAPE